MKTGRRRLGNDRGKMNHGESRTQSDWRMSQCPPRRTNAKRTGVRRIGCSSVRRDRDPSEARRSSTNQAHCRSRPVRIERVGPINRDGICASRLSAVEARRTSACALSLRQADGRQTRVQKTRRVPFGEPPHPRRNGMIPRLKVPESPHQATGSRSRERESGQASTECSMRNNLVRNSVALEVTRADPYWLHRLS